MNIGKLNTFFTIVKRQSGKDTAGQTITTYTSVGEVRGQHIIRNMTMNQNANRENPVVSEFVFTYNDPEIVPKNYLIDDMGNQFAIVSVRRTNDRSLIQSAVQLITDKVIEVV